MDLRNRRAVLGAIAVTALAGVTGALSVRSQPSERVIRVRAYKFSYEPNEIVVKLNEPVVLEFTSSEVVMVGTFAFHCDVFCGDGHEDMDGTIRVVA